MHVNNSNTNESDLIVKNLEAAGFRASFLPFSYFKQILNIYESHEDNSENTPFNIKKWFHNNQPPNISFSPLSFLVVSFRSPEGEILLNYKEKEISIPIPPTYLDDSVRKRLNDTLKETADYYQLAKTQGISLKLLAVLSGLGKYGRNTLCYLDGFGSFCNFEAYYTNIPCEDKNHKLTSMDVCKSCGLCMEKCPTKAIGGELAIDTSRCLTMLNEFSFPMPDWLLSSVHHAIVGCMRCQEICPVNKSVPSFKKKPLVLTEAETEMLLASTSDKLPPELIKKLSDYGLWHNFISLAGRNAKMVIEAIDY